MPAGYGADPRLSTCLSRTKSDWISVTYTHRHALVRRVGAALARAGMEQGRFPPIPTQGGEGTPERGARASGQGSRAHVVSHPVDDVGERRARKKHLRYTLRFEARDVF